MSIALYRRHRRNCKGHHPHNSRTSEYDERKKGWRSCECPIFVSGTLQGSFQRRNTGRWQWDNAKAAALRYEQAGTWSGNVTAPHQIDQPPEPNDTRRITIEQAISAFKTEFSETSAPNTQKKYRLLLDKLQTFSKTRGYVMIDQWKPLDVRELRSSWKVAPQTAAKNISTIKSFFEFCLANEWIPRNPARLVKHQRTRDAADKRNDQKLPFSDAELKLMYDTCETQYGKQPLTSGEVNRYNRKWTGQDLADFISISVYTGLRISDVCTFRADRLHAGGQILVRTTKAGSHVYTWAPKWLQERIRERATTHGPHIFGEHTTKDINVITDVWRRKLIKLWDLCGPWKEKPFPHRFRHTFARVLLESGVTVRDVADLLGNSEQMVRKHYSAWIPERQARLTKILQDAFANKPKPDSAAIG